MTTYHKQLSDYYNHEQTEKSGSNEQVISDPDNHLWPSHKFIDKNFKDEGQWYDDHSDMDYNTEDPKIESTFQSTHAEFHKISNNLNDTHIYEVINDSTLHSLEGKIGFGLGLSLLFLLLIILMYIIYREWLQRYLQSKNDSNHNSYNRDFCFDCDFARKMTLKKITNISIRKLQNHYDDEIDRCHKHIPDIDKYSSGKMIMQINENLWLLEKSRLVVFHEMKLGSGAFCNVYKGAIEGLAPICKVNPSLAAFGIFKDCMCAVKMLPSTADDTAHADFMQVSNLNIITVIIKAVISSEKN
ncbi:unnamed protein product [Onchocerca ochengi]|uniref:Protein kinase domain-containing protein n=1 Tax=Onchocerca ochengi TaxID=42157 RepID=A0A182ENZ6_ONCOC|nr:unnamed protein product [Onchocerca ochengi]